MYNVQCTVCTHTHIKHFMDWHEQEHPYMCVCVMCACAFDLMAV